MKKARLIIVFLVAAALVLPPMAQARGGHGGGSFIPGLCIGGILGLLLSPTVAVPAVPLHSPNQCFKAVPEQWEMRWDPYSNTYVRQLIPQHFVPIPCP